MRCQWEILMNNDSCDARSWKEILHIDGRLTWELSEPVPEILEGLPFWLSMFLFCVFFCSRSITMDNVMMWWCVTTERCDEWWSVMMCPIFDRWMMNDDVFWKKNELRNILFFAGFLLIIDATEIDDTRPPHQAQDTRHHRCIVGCRLYLDRYRMPYAYLLHIIPYDTSL